MAGETDMQDLTGKNAIVTGGASGIGFGIAKALAGAGVNVAIADIQPGPLEQARAAIAAMGVKSLGIVVDVTDPASVEAAGRTVSDAFGKLHIAVNNAGVAMHGTQVADVGLDEWRWVMGVNVNGVIHGIHSFLPLIRAHNEGGHVVNTASISGFFLREGGRQGAYSMTKYAVVALSEALEQELAGSGIGVSVLCPGAVQTKIFDSAATRPERFGGAYARPEQEKLKERMLAAGLSPDVVGARVVQAIRGGEFYIFTHANELDAIRARHARIEAALAAAG
jgi:NAD(P)-dependent dehydrogenase (short-subunit alcohol dehydrogenase family)